MEPCDFDFDLEQAAQVSATGDWEVKYGNPVLSVDGLRIRTWAATKTAASTGASVRNKCFAQQSRANNAPALTWSPRLNNASA